MAYAPYASRVTPSLRLPRRLSVIFRPVITRTPIAIGAKVKSTRYPVKGLVTAIVWAGYFYAIQVDNRHSDDAAHYELLSEPTYQGFNYVNPFSQEATSGNFEVIVSGEGDRIYFTEDAHQVVALVAATIGLKNPP